MKTHFTVSLTPSAPLGPAEALTGQPANFTGTPFPLGPWQVQLDAQGPQEHRRIAPDLVALLRGTLYDRDLDGVLELYRHSGDDFARQLEGSFALLLLDLRSGRVLGLTDRLGSHKLYALHEGGRAWLSTSPATQAFRQRPVSLAGVGSYLVNGYMANGLTPYEGVRSLSPRALHEVRPEGLDSRPYWRPPLEGPTRAIRDADARAELAGLLQRAVQRRVRAAGSRVHLSLSGGYDSRGLLSLLTRTGTQVQTFSYTLNTAAPGSDSGVATRLAAQYGAQHQTLVAYRGDLLSALRLNARWGQGASAYCEEADAWAELEAQAPTDLFTGEQVFEVQPSPLRSSVETLNRVRVSPAGGLHLLTDRLPPPVSQALNAAWTQEYEGVLAQGEQWPPGYPRELGLLLSQYEPYFLLPWREHFGGRSAQIHTPYLDTDVLEFLGRLPARLLADKAILKQTLRQLDPALLQVPLARTQGYEADWRAELMRVTPEQWEPLWAAPSRLDELINPEVIRHLIAALGAPSVQQSAYVSARRVLGRARRTPLARRLFGAPLYRAKTPSLPGLLLSLLTLREVLS
ncbi:asparagine synthase-related protein [Deinococcus koreensis]|uniref:asparagine synthase (glutamine-hydrolyzing) n=1 Tax=Deinococcus koreensis TaxID=2054903 RepID=A0A2K3UTB5_9DEIO|nr:asparagine synthase-related protein [Deinococcus koreensis]PNY79771.1 hypothetical protein CVO96_17630 [Deinococcus koreensis]